MRLIDANELALKLRHMGYMDENEEVQEVIDNAPTFDAVSREKYEAREEARKILVEFADDLLAELKERVEVVRCKDCKYNVLGECAITNMIHQDESFCSWGVEK